MAEKDKPSDRKTRRSPDFRYYPADSAAIGVGRSEVKIVFGVSELDGTRSELTAIQMSHRTARRLQESLTRVLNDFNEQKPADTDPE